MTRYLSRAAILTTLASIAGAASAGSAIVFNYAETDTRANEDRVGIERRVDAAVEAVGERIRTSFRPAEIARELGELGYDLLEDLGADGTPRALSARPPRAATARGGPHLPRRGRWAARSWMRLAERLETPLPEDLGRPTRKRRAGLAVWLRHREPEALEALPPR